MKKVVLPLILIFVLACLGVLVLVAWRSQGPPGGNATLPLPAETAVAGFTAVADGPNGGAGALASGGEISPAPHTVTAPAVSEPEEVDFSPRPAAPNPAPVPEGAMTVEPPNTAGDSIGAGGETAETGGKETPSDSITLLFQVVDFSTSQPIGDFTIQRLIGPTPVLLKEPSSHIQVTGTSGEFVRFRVQAPGYATGESGSIAFSNASARTMQAVLLRPAATAHGRVVDSVHGEPIAGCRVVAMPAEADSRRLGGLPSEHTITDEGGRFTLTVPSGPARLQILPSDPYVTAYKSIDIPKGRESDVGVIEVGSGTMIRVHVRQANNNSPVAETQVQLRNESTWESWEKETDAQGSTRFAHLPPGDYRLEVPEYNRDVQLKAWGPEDVYEETILVGSAEVFGRITSSGQPLRAWVVLQHEESTEYSAEWSESRDGFYSFPGLVPGTYAVVARPHWNLQAFESHDVTVGPGQRVEHDIDIPRLNLAGFVRNTTGEPIPGVRISAEPDNPPTSLTFEELGVSAVTDREGRFELKPSFDSTFRITASHADYQTETLTALPSSGEASQIEIVLEPASGATITSVVYSLDTEGPLQKAWCYLTAADGTPYRFDPSHRGADGVLTMNNIPPGRYDMEISAWGYSVLERQIEVAAEDLTFQDVLYRAGSLLWKIARADGSPAAGLPVRAEPLDPASIQNPRAGTTGPDGVVTIRGLAPGQYQLTAGRAGQKPLLQTFATLRVDELTRATGVLAKQDTGPYAPN
ncbi:MAG: carboxypeptidase regulatory-like domain-containing protein [Sumerlaeia bacterium]